MIRWDRLILREVRLPFKHFFETSFGRTYEKEAILVELIGGGLAGWGECVAAEGPFYSYEDVRTAWHILTAHLIPSLPAEGVDHPSSLPGLFCRIRGHPMAKAALESAAWDLAARREEKPLWQLLGGTLRRIPCGVSIGIQDSVDELLRKIEAELEGGYRKIKIKVKPGWDREILQEVRSRFPEIPLMADANAAYREGDFDRLREWDRFRLMMIEQPLYSDDIFTHAKLQRQLSTPLCLDESIRHARDAGQAIEAEACRIINIKQGRVGGATEALRIHDACQQAGIPVWCGGMLETGIGRAHNIALSTLENFTIPGDVSGSRRYFDRDVIRPCVEVTSDGFIEVPEGPGIGYEPDREWIDAITISRKEFELS